MAQTFVRHTARQVSTGGALLPTSAVTGSTQLVVSGLIVCNTEASAPVTVSVSLQNGGVQTYLVYNSEISPGESLIAIGWDQKLVMTSGDQIKIVTNNADHQVDAILSVLEITP